MFNNLIITDKLIYPRRWNTRLVLGREYMLELHATADFHHTVIVQQLPSANTSDQRLVISPPPRTRTKHVDDAIGRATQIEAFPNLLLSSNSGL